MRNPRSRTFSDDEMFAAAGVREVAAQARVGMFGGALVLERARVAQLTRDRDRALRRGDEARAGELDAQLGNSSRRVDEMATERAKEAIVPSPVPADQATVRGRISDRGQAAKGLQVQLIDVNGREMASARSDARGAFELSHEPAERVSVRVSDPQGGHLLDRSDLHGPPAGSSIYLELRIDGIAPTPPAPEPPPPDSEGERVVVPVLRGLTEEEARKALSAVGLRGRHDGEVPSAEHEGRIVSQEPKAGDAIARGSEVGYKVGSANGEPFPDLRGETLRNAVGRIEKMELSVGAIEMVDEPRSAGRITDTVPAPDEPYTRETRVMLRVGTGEDKADLSIASYLFASDPRARKAGLNEATIRRRLTDAGIASVEEMRALADEGAEAVDERLKIGDRQNARLARQVLAEVISRFPGRSS